MSAKRVALRPNCVECDGVWLPANEESWQARWIDDLPDERLVFHCPECAEREFDGQNLARRSEDRGHYDVRQWSAEVDRGHRWGGRCRVHRQDRVCTGHPRRLRRRRQRHCRHLPGGRPKQLHRRRGHRRVRLEHSAEHSVRRPNRSSVRAGNPSVVGSWSPMGTTTGCCGSGSTARSPSSSRSTTSSPPGWR
jgi:hypothetical protein